MDNKIRVLAVADPAVMGYIKKGVLKNFDADITFDIFPWEKYYSTMMNVFEGDAEYDIVMVAGHLWKRDFIEKGYILPIELEEEDILPIILKEIKYNDKYYLSPSFCDGHMVVYRKSKLRDIVGYLPKDVITPDEYIDIAFKLKNAGEKIVMKAHESEIFTDALPFLRLNGADVYSENGEILCDDTRIVEGLCEYVHLSQCAFSDTDTYGNDEVCKKLQSGEAAMGITWSGQLGVVCDEKAKNIDDLGFCTLSTAWNVTWSFAISSKCKDIELANKLLKYLRSPEVDVLAGEVSGAPVRRKSYISGGEKYPWYLCQLKMIENAKLLPDLLNAGDKNGVLYDEIHKAFRGEKTANSAMKEAKIRIKEIENK